MQLAALIIPILPGLVWLWVIYRTDRYDPEPKRLVAITFFLGVLSIIPAVIGERVVDIIYPYLRAIDLASADGSGEVHILPIAIACFLVIGPAEELAKFLAVRLYVYRKRDFDEPIDGVIYAAAAALGFASLENMVYVVDFQHGGAIRWGMLGMRSFLALPGHVIFAATWGYALGRQRFDPEYRVWPRVIAAAGLHGLYDFLLMYPPTRPLIVLYMAVMGPVLVRQIRSLLADSPFAPLAEGPALAAELAPPEREPPPPSL
jgi:RsiW-degrading membrane proteinase PrsW (M82 family)